MNAGRNIIIAVLMTVTTTLLLGIAYPLLVTALAQAIFPDKANGQMMVRDGRSVGSQIIGQAFSSPQYFHGRPSAAGSGYDAANSGGSNLGPTNKKFVDVVGQRVASARVDNPSAAVPIDLVTSSASGLDPHISAAAALFQVPRIAAARHAPESDIRRLLEGHIEKRQLGFLGEPRVNVLLLNLALDDEYREAKR
jgi:potassium-transporting ATPase KdpC subunit